MIFFSNCGFQVHKPKSLYTLSHRCSRLHDRVLSLSYVIVASFYKKAKFSFQFKYSLVSLSYTSVIPVTLWIHLICFPLTD